MPESETRLRAKVEAAKGFLEHRTMPGNTFEVDQTADVVRLHGYAAVTGRRYSMGGHDELIQPGAFKRTLNQEPGPDVQFLVNHGIGGQLPLARTRSGTLALREDAIGLYYAADLDAEDPDVQQLVRKIRRGDIDQASFAFRCTDDGWSSDAQGDLRTIRSADLHRGDVSAVNQGANPSASVKLRAASGVVSDFTTEARAWLDAERLRDGKAR